MPGRRTLSALLMSTEPSQCPSGGLYLSQKYLSCRQHPSIIALATSRTQSRSTKHSDKMSLHDSLSSVSRNQSMLGHIHGLTRRSVSRRQAATSRYIPTTSRSTKALVSTFLGQHQRDHVLLCPQSQIQVPLRNLFVRCVTRCRI